MKSLSTLNTLGRTVSSRVFIPTLDVMNIKLVRRTYLQCHPSGRLCIEEEPYRTGEDTRKGTLALTGRSRSVQSLLRALGNEDFAQQVLGGIILGGGRCRKAAETRKG